MEAMLSDPTNYLFRPQEVMKEFLEGTQEAISQLVAADNIDAAYAYSEDLLALFFDEALRPRMGLTYF